MIYLIPLYMGIMSRLSGNGFGSKWVVPWLPELLFCLPIALAPALIFHPLLFIPALAISYAGMQSGTWTFLRWESHDDPNKTRKATLKPVYDFVAGLFGWKLGDEGYAWIAAGTKGFVISLPLGGILGALLWPLGYEIGSHADKLKIKDPHAVSEFMAGFLMGFAVLVFIRVTA